MTGAVLGFVFTSERVQGSLDAPAQKQELGCHGDQEAARRPVLVPKQTLQCGVVNFGKGQQLRHLASLQADTHAGGIGTSLWLTLSTPL